VTCEKESQPAISASFQLIKAKGVKEEEEEEEEEEKERLVGEGSQEAGEGANVIPIIWPEISYSSCFRIS